jgi:hypothetical protein
MQRFLRWTIDKVVIDGHFKGTASGTMRAK